MLKSSKIKIVLVMLVKNYLLKKETKTTVNIAKEMKHKIKTKKKTKNKI